MRTAVEQLVYPYDFIEAKQILLAGVTGGGVIQNQRCYLNGIKLKGKRIVGIDVKSNATNFIFNDLTILRRTLLQLFTLTLVDKIGDEVVKDFPIRDLFDLTNTNGKIRQFNVIPEIEECYIVDTNFLGVIFPANPALWLNFYTTNK